MKGMNSSSENRGFMKSTIAAIAITLALVGSALVIVIHYQRKHEDDVAYFALNVIHKDTDACYADKSYFQADCSSIQGNAGCVALQKKYFREFGDAGFASRMGMDCIVSAGNKALECIDDNYKTVKSHSDMCESEQVTSLRGWAVKYPRQGANLKRDAATAKRKALEDARNADAKNLDKQKEAR
jgi:hypothetical protein